MLIIDIVNQPNHHSRVIIYPFLYSFSALLSLVEEVACMVGATIVRL